MVSRQPQNGSGAPDWKPSAERLSPGRYGCSGNPRIATEGKDGRRVLRPRRNSESAAEKPEAVEPVAEAVAAAETAGPAEELQTEPAPTAQTASSPVPTRRRGRGRRGGRDHQRPNRSGRLKHNRNRQLLPASRQWRHR